MTTIARVARGAFATGRLARHSLHGGRRPAIYEFPARISSVLHAGLRWHDDVLIADVKANASSLALPTYCLPRRRFAASATWIALLPLAAALAGCTTPAAPTAQPTVPAGNAGEMVTVALTDFAFTPDRITLRAGVPIRLRLVNKSDGGHDFSAPKFFAESTFSPGSTVPASGAIEVGSHQTVEIALTPRAAGSYPVECTHFLHGLFGMTATIDVVP
jgi:plastocyanin